MDVRFDCTMCGKCCHDLKLPVSVDEAMSWLRRGGSVKILCEALPWPSEPALGDRPALYRKERSFAASSGALPTRILVTLVAAFDGACPFLRADMRCGAYAERPRVCRIYPAEINPFVELSIEQKACPPDAWADDRPWLLRGGRLVDSETDALVSASHAAAVADTEAKAALCALLGIDRAALANEGFVVHSPPREHLLAALEAARRDPTPRMADWQILSNRTATVAMLVEAEAVGAMVEHPDTGEYLGFFPPS